MPSKNTEKLYIEETYYHIFNRGTGYQAIFKDEQDYSVFLNLLKRYLGPEPVKDKQNREYPWYHDDLKLEAFCLMPNHYHLLVVQYKPKAITDFLRSLCTSYSRYFNKKYRRVGHLFQDRFKAKIVNNDGHLIHISRYIHLNPDDYRHWQFSSLPYYLGKKKADWVNPDSMLELFEGESYEKFLADYEDHRQMLKEIKAELADK